MFRTSIQYKFTVGKPVNVEKDYFTPLVNEKYGVVSLDEFLNINNPAQSFIFENHQIQFSVNMDNKSKPNASYITIYNVDSVIEKYFKANKGANIACRLEAGDNIQGLKLIAEGTVTKVEYKDDTENNTLKLTLGDGVIAAKNAKTVRTYPRGTSYKKVLKDLSGDLKIPVGLFSDTISGNLVNPVSLVGKTHDLIDGIAKALKHDYSIQNNKFSLIPQDRRVEKQVSVITKESGLIGRVSLETNDTEGTSTAKAKSDTYSIKFSCLLDGSLKPNETVYVKDGDYNGAFKITSVHFEGDYEGNKWLCHVIADKTQGVLVG